MESATLAEIGATNELATDATTKDVDEWLQESDAYRLVDVEYAISITELGAARDRDGITTSLAIGALVVALAAVGLPQINWWLQMALGAFVILALAATVHIQSRHAECRRVLRSLYHLRDRGRRYVVPVKRWSRRGQVYLAPER